MTVNGRKYSLPTRIKDIMRFQETFPSNNNPDTYPSKRGSRSLTPSPKNSRRTLNQCSGSMGLIESISEDDVIDPVYLVRSNSWSGCRRGLRPQLSNLANRSIDSHRSSTISLPDVIEEDSSEEEFADSSSLYDDHLKCASCRNSNLSTSLDSVGSDYSSSNEISYCYNCKHLYQGKQKTSLSVPQMMGQVGADNRRIPWTCHDAPYSPRATRKNSNNGVELPIISEPSVGEENTDNEEIQKLVKKEVDKLLKFNSKIESHPKTKTKTLVTLDFYQ